MSDRGAARFDPERNCWVDVPYDPERFAMFEESMQAAESVAADLGPNAVPDRIAIDAHGYGWRVWDDHELWSMVPTNPDNSPVPEPVTWFVPVPPVPVDRDRPPSDTLAWAAGAGAERDRLAERVEALEAALRWIAYETSEHGSCMNYEVHEVARAVLASADRPDDEGGE